MQCHVIQLHFFCVAVSNYPCFYLNLSFVSRVGTMVRKRKAEVVGFVDDGARDRKRVRNRASPVALVRLYEFLSPDQKAAVTQMELDSLLDIKCHTLHTPVIEWLTRLYDKHTREFVVLGRGRIPLNEDTVFSCLGLPVGSEPVPYHVDSEIQDALAPLLFPQDGSTPSTTRVFEILKHMVTHGNEFKQTFVMYVVSTILSPTTRNHVSNKCYPIMVSYLYLLFLFSHVFTT
jgi:hypothetical protein